MISVTPTTVRIALVFAVVPVQIAAATESSSNVEIQPMTGLGGASLSRTAVTSNAPITTEEDRVATPGAILESVRARFSSIVAGMGVQADEPGAQEDLAGDMLALSTLRRTATSELLAG